MTDASPVLRVRETAPETVLRLGLIVAGLAALIARRFLRDPKFGALVGPLWSWLNRSVQRFGRARSVAVPMLPLAARARARAPMVGVDRAARVRFPAGRGWLVTALGHLSPRPQVLVSASAVGWYGDTGDREVTEPTPQGTGFLADVCAGWEAATRGAVALGIRVVNVRIGVVLSPDGGMLGKLLPVFRAGLGGPVGTGQQWLPWIALADLLAVFQWAIATPGVSGPVNAVAPHPVRQGEFAKTLGHVLHRPAVLPTPAFALRLAFGQMADEVLLAGQRVRPDVLARGGFVWGQAELEGVLRGMVGG